MIGLLFVSSKEQAPLRKRRRPELLPARGTGSPCVLEEAVPCEFETPTPCDSLCRHSEWSEWSECSEKLLDFGVMPVKTSSREKYVSAEAGGACAEFTLKDFDEARCAGEHWCGLIAACHGSSEFFSTIVIFEPWIRTSVSQIAKSFSHSLLARNGKAEVPLQLILPPSTGCRAKPGTFGGIACASCTSTKQQWNEGRKGASVVRMVGVRRTVSVSKLLQSATNISCASSFSRTSS